MAAYSYEAINAQGLRQRGEIHAADLTAARDQLRARGLLAQTLREQAASGEGGSARFKKVKSKSLQVFSRQLATMIEAGVSVTAAFATLEDQTDDKYLREVIAEVRSDVESGMVLSKAFGRHPKVFNKLFVAMIEAGESSGTLDSVLDRIATQIEKESALKRRVKSAMVYPLVVITFATLVLVFMLMFIVPVFQKVFDDLGGSLPKPTQILIDMSYALRHYWFIIFPAIGGIIYGFLRWKKSERGRPVWDTFKLRIPMRIGDVVQKIALARFSRTLSSLVTAGVDIIRALEITAATAGNWVIEQSVDNVPHPRPGGRADQRAARDATRRSRRWSVRWSRSARRPASSTRCSARSRTSTRTRSTRASQSLTSIIEPVLMIGVGIMVGTIVIAMYLPMFKMLTLVQ